MGRWHPQTRGIFYDPEKIIERLLYYASFYKELGDFNKAKTISALAEGIKEKHVHPIEGAREVIELAQETSLYG